MIQLHTRKGIVGANVFLTENERSVGIVLYRGGKPIAAESFDGDTARRVKTECLKWLARHELSEESRLALVDEIDSTFEMLMAYRQNGPDISNGWAGPHSRRRLPKPDEIAS